MITTLAIDKSIKDKASLRAKKDSLSVSAVARILLADYAAGKIEIGVRPAPVTEWKLSPEMADEILRTLQDKDSPAFSTMTKAIAHLRKE